MMGLSPLVGPIFTDSRWICEGKGKNTKNAMNAHKPDTNAHQHNVIRFLSRARIHTPNRINKRKTLG